MTFLFIAVGSTGDILPLLAIAVEMCRRGHRATLVSGPLPGITKECGGVRLISLSSEEEGEKAVRDKPTLGTRYASHFIANHSVVWNQRIFEIIESSTSREFVTVAVDRPNIWADLLAYKLGTARVVRVLIDLPVEPRFIAALLPNSAVQRLLDARVQAKWATYLARQRIEVGWNHAFRLYGSVRPLVHTIALWPDWLVTQNHLVGIHRTFGFVPLPSISTRTRKEIQSVDVVFAAGTEGTTREWEHQFATVSKYACKALGKAGVLIGSRTTSENPDAGVPFYTCRFTPLHDLLEGAEAMVHHGGIGTAAAALERGIPQIAIPRIFGQPVNAAWLQRAGVCVVLQPSAWKNENAIRALDTTINNRSMRARAQEFAARIDRTASLQAVCRFLEELP